MNVGQLAAQPPSQVQRVASDAEDVSSEFLSIRMLNNRARVRLSEPLDLTRFPSKAQLLTVASGRGWFVAIKRSSSTGLSLIASTVSDLRARLLSADGKNDEPIAVSRTVPLPQGVNPNYLVFASNESKLLVGLAEGAIVVYDANAICSAGTEKITPIYTFPATTSTSARHIYPNPGDLPDLVAVLREPDGNPNTQLVEILDVTALQSVAGWRSGGTPQTLPMSISWSPKGKQIAIGMQSGDIMTFSPTEVNQPKMFIPKPLSARNQSAIHTTWLANPTFYTIYAPLPLTEETDQAHFIISYDGKRNSASDVAVPISFFSSGLRPPGAFTVVLRNWGPAKIMLIVGDTTTADIGVIVSVAKSATEDKWQRLTLDDVATPSMPLGEEASETTMVGLELDLKNQQQYNHTMPSGENLEVPPPPIMFAYASDGTVIAWYLINTQGISYPGMTTDSTTTPSAVPQQSAQAVQPVQPVQPAQNVSAFGQPVPSAFGQSSGFGVQPASAFGQPAFAQPSAFGPASGSAFGQSPGSAFGQSNTAFGQNNTGEYRAFANAGPSGFGTTSAFSSAPTTPAQPMVSESTDSMSTDAGPDFGGLSLGASSNDTAPKAGFGTTGLFGVTSQPAPVPSQPASAFANYIKPSAGFGAFSNYVQPLAQSKPQVSVEPPKASSAFGQTGFGSLTTRSASGQPAFGKPAFGQIGFASSPMSMTPQASPMSATSSSAFGGGGGGAFGNYAGGQSAFAAVAQNATPTVPVWKTAAADKPTGGFSAFGGSGGSTVFGQQAPAAISQATPSTPPSAPAQPAPSTTALSSTPPPVIALEDPTLTRPTVPATPAASAPPVTSATSTTPTAPPLAGAFANLQAVPAPFGSTSSFGGTFGVFNKDSPFANPKPVSEGTDFAQRMSAFSNTPAQLTPSTSGSAFGQTSAFGVHQSAFGQSSTPPAATTTPKASPSTSAFSAFSGQQSAFNQFAGPQKSFSDMLREGEDEDGKGKGKGKAPVSAFSSTPQTPVKSAEESTSTTPAKTPPPLLSAQQKGKSKESSVEPAENDAEKASKGKSTDEAKSKTTNPRAKISADESSLYLSESLSSLSSSFVEVDAPKDLEGDGDADADTIREPLSPDSEEGELERVDDGIDGFLSSPEQSEGQYEGDEEDDSGAEELGRITEVEEEAEEAGKDATQASPLTPTKVALPPSRSPSTTPKPQTPFIKLEPSTPKLDRAQSTTPPGSPIRDPPETLFPPPIIAQPSPVVPSPSQIPSLTSLNIGIGRPSTRPLRSSPLASTPLSGVNHDEEGKRESAGSAKPRPASPKIPFGQWAASESKPSSFGQQLSSPSIVELPVGGSSSEKKSLRPKTPPLLSSFGFAKPVQPTATSSPAANAPLPAGFPPPIKPYGSILMGPPVLPSGSLFGQSAQPAVAPASKPLGAPAPLFSQALPTAQKIVPAQPPKAEETLEEGIQKECAYLVAGLAKELESLRLLAQEASKKREELNQSKSAPSSGKGASVTFDDVSMLGKSLKATMKEITELENMRESLKTSIREVQSNMLKAKTRKEEIIRFDKAKSDVEFTKMLKTRSLGPEYVESQTQLRRDIRAMRDLIEKLEGHLQSSKRRLNQLRTGKPGINPPSLDTINRTFRNIDITVEQQTSDVNNLAARIAQLDLKGNLGSPIRDNRLPDDVSRRPLNVTPHVASSTAAALNAERSAHRLKEALLRVRKEPLLNVTAASAPPAPRSFETPKKKTSGTKDFDASFSLSDFEKPLPALSLPTEFPPFSIDPHASLSSGSSRNRANWKSRHHHEHPQIPAKSGGVGTPAAPPAFDWGPLPGVKPMTTLPMDVRNNLR